MFYIQIAWFAGLVIIGLLSYFGPDIIREQAIGVVESRERRHSFSPPTRERMDWSDYDAGNAEDR